MIVYEETAPILRFGEFEAGGRRVAVRALPYAGEVGRPDFRFDPIERRLIRRETRGRALVGPYDSEQWRVAFLRGPAGPALVGPCEEVEEIRGAFRAAAEGARQAGRGVYLLDAEPAGLPPDPGETFVAFFCWHPGPIQREGISRALGLGIPSGLLLPVIPGWTAEPEFLTEFLSSALAAGVQFVAPVAPSHDGNARRLMVEARGEADGFFEFIHHFNWDEELPIRVRAVRSAVLESGLAVFAPRPFGVGQPRANAAAAARLEEKAEETEKDEHRSSLLHAAARWIDESGRDLRAVLSEGNFRKVFPFGPEIAAEAEQVLREESA